jgi:hypothetical protein
VQPMEQAARRLEQLLLALQDESGSSSPPASARPPSPRPPSASSDPAAFQGEMIPPLAQLKALRAWQAEIHERTTAFAQKHPDLSRPPTLIVRNSRNWRLPNGPSPPCSKSSPPSWTNPQPNRGRRLLPFPWLHPPARYRPRFPSRRTPQTPSKGPRMIRFPPS